MANHKQALKRHRQSLVRRARNRHYKSLMKTRMKKALGAVEQQDSKEETQRLLKLAIATVDTVSGKGIIHKNTAARYVSRLARKLAAI